MLVRSIDIAAIDVGDRLRALDPAWVDALAGEIKVDGLTSPIRVAQRGTRYVLIDGARRLKACDQLGNATIAAVIEPEAALARDADLVMLGEIKGNLVRGDLTVLDHALYVVAWSEIYERTYATRKAGRPTKKVQENRMSARRAEIAAERAGINGQPISAANDDVEAPFVLSLTEAVRRVLGISGRSLRRLREISSIGRVRAGRLVGHPVADNRTELLLLSAQSADRQDQILDLLTGERPRAGTVAEAIGIIEGLPAAMAPSPMERVHQSLSRLSPGDQAALFEMNREAIERWMVASAPKVQARAGRRATR